MTPDQATAKMRSLIIENMSLLKRHEAHMALYAAACLDNDGKAADASRARIHDGIDRLLDNTAAQMLLQRQALG